MQNSTLLQAIYDQYFGEDTTRVMTLFEYILDDVFQACTYE